LERTIRLGPEHVSAYSLTIEPDTEFGARARKGTLAAIPEESQRAFLAKTESVLSGAGYRGYETSNFALPGRECRHNLAYWRREGYLGFGAGAHSFVPGEQGGMRRWNVRPPKGYLAAVAGGRAPVAGEERLTPDQALLESV